MAEKLTRYVWRHSAREQIVLLGVTFCSFPIVWISLELPKLIINDAIGGTGFPREILGLELDQTRYLLALCLAYLGAVGVNNGVKYLQNLQRGVLGERMLRRMRFDLYRRAMGRPLTRLKETSPGELVQMISAELAPIGDFIGAIIMTPVAQGGTFLVLLTFIMAQNPLIGAAALALYPVQAYVIPKLQARVVALIRLRLTNIRAMTREISESIGGAAEVQALAARRWHTAIVSRQLYDNYVIRRRIFILKFLIKFVNNVANHLTPFFIFLIGGYFVINGKLDVGALTAVLIAYKDLAAPWKDLLQYYQSFSDMKARYESVMENFDEDPEPGPLPEKTSVGPHALALTEAEVGGVSRPVTCHVPKASATVVVCADAGARSALLQSLAGLGPRPEETWTAGMPALCRAVAYVPPDPRAFADTIRGNLLRGLRIRPVGGAARDGDDAALSARRREARLTGAPPDDIEDDWIDPAEAGYADHEEIEARMLELAAVVDFEDDLYAVGLGSRLDPLRAPEFAADLLALRGRIARSEELAVMRADFIDVWAEDRYVPNAALGENLFFALPTDPTKRWPDYASDPAMLRVLDAADARTLLVEIGIDVCEALIGLFAGVDPESDLFRRYSLFPRAETATVDAIVRNARRKGVRRLGRAEQSRMIGIAFGYASARFRLGVMHEDDRMARVLAARGRLRAFVDSDSRFTRFDPDGYVPAFSVGENIFFGRVRLDRSDSWRPFQLRIDALLAEAGLREPILRAALEQRVEGAGGLLGAAQRRKLGLARALMRNPGALVLDQVVSGDSEADRTLRAAIRRELGGGALVWGSAVEPDAAEVDHVIRLNEDGRISEAPPVAGGESAN